MGIQTVSQALTNEGSTLGFRNKIINGDMRIDQRNAGSAVTCSSGSGSGYTVDRFAYGCGYGNPATDPSFTIQQSTDAPQGFSNSIKLTITTAASATPVSGDAMWFGQYIEGNNMVDLAWGTAYAKTVTVSFWVKSSITGTYSLQLSNGSSNYNYTTSYTINSANTWENKTITIPGAQSGTWASNTSIGMMVAFPLAEGSTYVTASPNQWISGNYPGYPGQTHTLWTTLGATWAMTGLQLEVGNVATPFERRPYGMELALCQRYFWRVYGQNIDICMNNQTAPYSSITFSTLTNPVTMRASGTFAHNMTNAKNTTSTPGADQWAWYIQNQGYASTSSGDIANLNGGGQLYCRIGAYTLAPTAASTGIRMGTNIYIENSAEL